MKKEAGIVGTVEENKEQKDIFFVFPGDVIPSNVKIDAWGSRDIKAVDDDYSEHEEEDEKEKRVATTAAIIVDSPSYPYCRTLHTMQKKYIPFTGDFVIGVVTQKTAENYMVDINSAFDATLNLLSFERATKKDKPNIYIGGLVYAIVNSSNKEYEAELTCICTDDQKGWATNENYFGELKGGYLIHTTVAMAHSLIGDNCFILERLARNLKFEVAIGVNGRVWIKAGTCLETITVANAIQDCFGRPLAQMEVIIRRHLETISQ